MLKFSSATSSFKWLTQKSTLFTQHTKHSTRSFSSQLPDFDPEKDYYRVLGVTNNSPDADIKKAYYKLA